MSVERPPERRAAPADLASRRWVQQLHADHPRHDQAVARLHDVLARAARHELQLGSNRNAIYKNLFDARRRLRESLAAAGHALTEETRA